MPENTPEPQAGTEPTPPAPPWGADDNFDPAKAWKLIEDLRADKERLAARPVMTDEQRQLLKDAQREADEKKSDLQRAQDELSRWQSEAEKWRTASVASRIEVLAAPEFADPSDAASALADRVAHYLDAGGVIKEDAIKADLADVLKRKPHWRRQADAPASRVPAPNRAQGSSGGTPAADPAAAFAAAIQGQLSGTG